MGRRKNLLRLSLAMALFIVGGAVCISLLEYGHLQQQIDDYDSFAQEMHDLNKQHGKNKNFDVKKMFDSFREVKIPPKNHWTWDGSAFFAFTVITTIGYGSYTPETVGGKVFTVIYALLGLGVASAFLSAVGENALDLVRYCFRRVEGNSSDKNQHNFLVVNIALGIFVLLSVCFYTVTEGWSIFDSWYFVFVSITTIGFGDLVPMNHVYMSCIFILFGLSICALWLESFDKFQKSTSHWLFHIFNHPWTFSTKHQRLLDENSKHKSTLEMEQEILHAGALINES